MFPRLRKMLGGGLACFAVLSLAAEPATVVSPTDLPADAAAARARLRVAPGLKVDLWASEPLVQNVTSLSFDDQGRAYVVESHRRRTSVFDIRNFKSWVPDDLALRTVEDRATFLRGQLATNAIFRNVATQSTRGGFHDFNQDGVIDSRDLEVESERIRLVWDQDQDGKADHAVTFADDFRTVVSGVAAGVLAQGSNVWFTCIPDLWQFTLTNPDFVQGRQQADGWTNAAALKSAVRTQRLATGFGVHVAFGGHDLHGLILGPDGRLYFTIADRGAAVVSQEGEPVVSQDAGAVFRCEPDGSNLELFATGLRNPQELAFDEFGNLWTGDNNGDGGDQARWTLVLEGANYGWTIGWQWLPKMGAWNSERLWQTRERNTASYLVPPVAHVGHGPAGIAYYPGTGLGDRFNGTFFYSDFPGGVRTFRVEPEGAFFRVAENAAALQDNSSTNFAGKLLWNLAPVDLAFPPGGGLVVADAFPTWEKDGKARLWRVFDPALQNDPHIAETRRLLSEGMSQRSPDALATLLSHPDFRVRLNAQWELAARGMTSWPTLSEVALRSSDPRARRHAIWGLSQIVRRRPSTELVAELSQLQPLLRDTSPDIRRHAARLLGASRLASAQGELRRLIEDSDPTVAAQAILAYRDLLGAFIPRGGPLRVRVSWQEKVYHSFPAAVQRLLPGPDSEGQVVWPVPALHAAAIGPHGNDPVVRHALVLMLTRLGEVFGPAKVLRQPLATWATDPDPRVRLALLLTERRLLRSEIVSFLHDADPQLVLEAARAIYDQPIRDSWLPLAELLREGSLTNSPLTNPASEWPANLTYSRDEWLDFVGRRAVAAASRFRDPALVPLIGEFSLRRDLPESLRVEALEGLANWATPPAIDPVTGLHRPPPVHTGPAVDPQISRRVLDAIWPRLIQDANTNVLFAALRTAEAIDGERFTERLSELSTNLNPVLRAEARRLSAARTRLTIPELIARAKRGPLAPRQAALTALSESKDPEAIAFLTASARELVNGQLPPELELEVFEAATRNPAVGTEAFTAWVHPLSQADPLATYRVVLHGGRADQGRKLFTERADWGCQRCHKLHGEGGEVGPDLTGLGRLKGREYLLRAILTPNAEIAAGFENVLLTLKDGSTVIGSVKSETSEELVILTPEAGRVTLKPTDVASRDRALSPMPEGLGDLMTRRELRDLIEALSEP